MPKKKPNQFINLIINIVVPTVILVKFSSADFLGPIGSVIVAIAFPLGYGIYDFVKRKEYNFFSIIGLLNIALTGGIAIFEIPPRWLAIKEAAVPLLIGILILAFQKKWPFVEKLLQEALDYERLHTLLVENNKKTEFNVKVRKGTYGVASSFLLSSFLNFSLAKTIVTSQPGTEAFAQQLGKLTALSYPVIAVPSMIVLTLAMVYVMKNLSSMTGLSLEEIMQPRSQTEN